LSQSGLLFKWDFDASLEAQQVFFLISQTRMGRVWLICCFMSCASSILFLWWPGRVPPIRQRSL